MATDKDISFATFNLYNLQLPGLSWRGKTYSRDQYEAKLDWSAGMLKRLDADVIAFQELWHPGCLEDLFTRAEMPDYELVFIKPHGETWYDIAVAAAVRRPWQVRTKRLHKQFGPGFRLVKRGDDDPEDNEIDVKIDKFSRTVIDLEITHDTRAEVPALRVFACHLKSKLGTMLDWQESRNEVITDNRNALQSALSTIRRTAEAAALREYLGQALRETDTPVVVLGDLNDGEHSNTLSILTEQPSHNLFVASGAGKRSDRGLYAASRLQAYRSSGGPEFSHVYKGERDILDHILVSEQFYDHSRNRKWAFRDMRVWNDYLEDDRPESPSTDHGLVRARFDWKPV